MRGFNRCRRLAMAAIVLTGCGQLFASATSEQPSPARRLSAIEVIIDGRGLVVSLAGDGQLKPIAIREAEHWPPRLVVDLPEVISGVPGITPIGAGPVEDIRVVTHSLDPLITRVVFELRRTTTYQIAEPEEGRGRWLTFVFPLDPSRAQTSPDDLDQDVLAMPPDDRSGPRVHLARAELYPVSGGSVPRWAGRRRVAPPAALRASPTVRPGQTPSELPVVVPFLGGLLRRAVRPEPSVARMIDAVLERRALRLPATGSRDFSAVRSPARAGSMRNDGPRLLDVDDVVAGARVCPEPLVFGRPLVLASARNSVTRGAGRTKDRSLPRIRPGRSRVGSSTTHLQLITQGAPRRYTGDPVSMDFQGADLRAVLRTFAEISSLNIVIDPQLDGTVDVALTDVPWDQALDVILRANQLGYVVDGTVVRIAPLAVLADEETQRRQLAEEQALSGEIVVLTRTLSYARADAMSDLITQSVLSARGQVQTDERTNTLIISDLESRLSAAEELLDTLDRAEPQVEIEARIVQAGRDFARTIGVQWGLTGRVAPDLGNTTPLTFPNRGGISGRAGTQGAEASGADARARETENVGTAVNLPAAAASSAIGVTMGAVDGSLNLDIVLSAAEGDGRIRLLSHPRVTTQNNVAAEIVQGDQIPIQTVSNNTVTVRFEDAALSLRVTPQITAEDTVIMQIEIDNDFADFGRQINGVPPIVTQRATTTVQVGDGDTTVIGGIFESERTSSNDRVPGLHRIPLLDWLFRSRSERESTDELLIFLTPKIVR